MTEELNEKQREFYEVVETHYKTFGELPTYRECMNYMGWKSRQHVFNYIKAIEKKGFWDKVEVKIEAQPIGIIFKNNT